ncbi:MAG: oligosaccharide flippase family protein [Sphingomonadales bacterium]|nr:oligosaccharide flippase family protein [Sphingomonadales bacterium]
MTQAGPKKASFRTRLLRASGWSVLMMLAENLLRLASNVIITRFLLPEAFGVMMFITMLLTALTLFADVGLKRSVAREMDGDDPAFLRVVWTVKIRRGLGIAGVMVLIAAGFWAFGTRLAPPGSVYADPRLPGLLCLAALSPVLQGLASSSAELMSRNLDYKRQVILIIITRLLAIAITVAAALISPTVWALVLGMLSANLMNTVLTHLLLSGPRMRWQRDAEIEARLWDFGRFVMWSSGLNFLGQNADRFLLASFLDSHLFGIYAVAMIWIVAGQMLMLKLLDNVAISGLAEVARTRPQDLERVYAKFDKLMVLGAAAAALACFFLGPIVLRLLYPDSFQGVGVMLQFLSLRFLALRFQSLEMLITVQGQSRVLMQINLIRAVVICIAMPLAFTLFGIEGALLVTALSSLSATPYLIWHAWRQFNGYGRRHLLADIGWLAMTLGLAAGFSHWLALS